MIAPTDSPRCGARSHRPQWILLFVGCLLQMEQIECQTSVCKEQLHRTCGGSWQRCHREGMVELDKYKKRVGNSSRFDNRSEAEAAVKLLKLAEHHHPGRAESPKDGTRQWIEVLVSLLDALQHTEDAHNEVLRYSKMLLAANFCERTARSQALVEREYCYTQHYRNAILAARALEKDRVAQDLLKQAQSLRFNGQPIIKWQHAWQLPSIYRTGLRAKPWWRTEEVPFAQALEQQYPLLRHSIS